MSRLQPKILICDDSSLCCEMVKEALEGQSFEVVALDSPFGFGAALLRERPDLVLLDVSMPALQGDQLVRLARRHDLPPCPIVFFSDRPEEELWGLMEQVGAAGFLHKTGDPETLAQAIRVFLDKSDHCAAH